MDDSPDPILNFFTPAEASQDNLLYTALSVERAAEAEEIRKAYRRAALRLHPDKHAGKTPGEKEEMSREFQKVGFAYAVLSDEKKAHRIASHFATRAARRNPAARRWSVVMWSVFRSTRLAQSPIWRIGMMSVRRVRD
jgi:hypothetical protein